MDINAHMKALSNSVLLEATESARIDLEIASKDRPESDEHQNCFAAFLLYSQECKKRGL